jgi:hypothetical protein
MGKIDKGQKCSVEGCGKEATRSVNAEKAKIAFLKFEGKHCYGTKKVDQIEKWRYSG